MSKESFFGFLWRYRLSFLLVWLFFAVLLGGITLIVAHAPPCVCVCPK